MRISEMLVAIARYLESPDNEAILLAEYDEECLKVVASSCVEAANALRVAAEKVDGIEPPPESNLTAENVEKIAALADAFDSSGDDALRKQASVLDELLLSIASPPNAYAMRKDLLDDRAVQMAKLYQGNAEQLHKTNMIEESKKAIEKSEMVKNMPEEVGSRVLLTRNCPNHAGSPLARIGQDLWQCQLDHHVFDFKNGFQLENGKFNPGGDVSLQTSNTMNANYHSIFDTREGRLQNNK